jgi:hypothetical protein
MGTRRIVSFAAAATAFALLVACSGTDPTPVGGGGG